MEPVLVSVGNNFKIWDTDGYSQLYGVGTLRREGTLDCKLHWYSKFQLEIILNSGTLMDILNFMG